MRSSCVRRRSSWGCGCCWSTRAWSSNPQLLWVSPPSWKTQTASPAATWSRSSVAATSTSTPVGAGFLEHSSSRMPVAVGQVAYVYRRARGVRRRGSRGRACPRRRRRWRGCRRRSPGQVPATSSAVVPRVIVVDGSLRLPARPRGAGQLQGMLARAVARHEHRRLRRLAAARAPARQRLGVAAGGTVAVGRVREGWRRRRWPASRPPSGPARQSSSTTSPSAPRSPSDAGGARRDSQWPGSACTATPPSPDGGGRRADRGPGSRYRQATAVHRDVWATTWRSTPPPRAPPRNCPTPSSPSSGSRRPRCGATATSPAAHRAHPRSLRWIVHGLAAQSRLAHLNRSAVQLRAPNDRSKPPARTRVIQYRGRSVGPTGRRRTGRARRSRPGS